MAEIGRGSVFTTDAPVTPTTPTYNFICAEVISAGEVLCQSKVFSGEVLKAQASDVNRMPAFGVATEGGVIGDTIAVQTMGSYDDIEKTENLDIQEAIYVSDTAGKATKNPPANVGCGQQRIGIAWAVGNVMLEFDLTVVWIG